MSTVHESLALWLADYYLLSAGLLTIAVTLLTAIEQPVRRRAITRSMLIALYVLAILCVVPGWSKVSLISDRPIALNRQDIEPLERVESAAAGTGRIEMIPQTPEPPGTPVSKNRAAVTAWFRDVSWSSVAVGTWAIGAAWVAVWLVIGLLAARRLRRAARSAPSDMLALAAESSGLHGRGTPAELLISSRIDVAVAIGIWRPAVLLPAEWIVSPSRDELRMVLAHEQAHLAGHDLHWLAASRGLMILLWAQPFYWLLRRRMRLDQEALADAAAAELSSRQRYAEQLVAWARDLAAHRTLRVSSAVGLWESPLQLRQRIALLVDERFTVLRHCSRRWSISTVAALLVAATTLSLMTLQPSTQAAEGPEATANDDDSDSLHYGGMVVDKRSGKPVAGAKVVVRRKTSSIHPWPTLAETEHFTANDGTYQFTIPPEQLTDKKLYIELDVAHGDYAPRTEFGYALSMIRKNEKLGARPFFDRVEIEPAEPITGLVKTPAGEPAASMPVLAYSKADPKDMAEYGSFARGQTDSKGRFELNVTKAGHAVLWLLPDHYSQQTHLINDRRGDLGTFPLEKGVRLSGQVVDSDGGAIPNVWVNAELKDGPAKKPIQMPVADNIDRSALTDAEGRFELPPLPPGTYRILPEEHPEENPRRDRKPHPVPAVFVPQRITLSADEEPTPLQIQAAETVTIEAQIYDSAGKPRSGHEVDFFGRVGSEASFYHAQGRPDENGHIELKVPQGIHSAKLQIHCNEHQVLRYRRGAVGEKRAEREIDLGTLTDDYRGIEIYYYTAPVVIVAARDAEGKLLSDAKPAIYYRQSVKPRDPGTSWINDVEGEVHFELQEDGRWRSSQLLPDEDFRLTVLADGFRPETRAIKLEESQVKELGFALTKAADEEN